MIVIRITTKGQHREHRSEAPQLVLGSDPSADVVYEGLGWAGREAVLVHHGTDVELRRPDGQGDLRLRVGDTARLGHARIALVGLLPLPEPEPTDEEAPDGAPLFGGYDEDWPPEQPFSLVDELASPSAPDPSPEPRPKESAPAKEEKRAAALPRADTAPPKRAVPPPLQDEEPTPPESRPARTPATDAAEKARRDKKPESRGTPPLPRPPAPAFRQAEFGEELISQLKRAPFFMLSVALHALAFFILTLLQVPPEAGGKSDEDGTLYAAIEKPLEEQRFGDEKDDSELLADLKLPDLPDIPTPTLPDEASDSDRPIDDAEELEPLEHDDAAPFTVGINPSLRSAESSTGKRQKRISPSEMTEDFTGREARTANERAADYIRSQLGRGSGREGDPLRRLTKTDLLVVQGTFDHVGKVLDALKLPFTKVLSSSLALKNAPSYSQHKVIFWNCSESLPQAQQEMVTRRLKRFVEKGGFLFTTDWAIGNVLEPAFKGYVTTSGPRRPLPETIVDIRPAKSQAGHELLEGVFHRGVRGRWWLEQASFDIQPKHRNVETLIESPDLRNLYGRNPAVAVTFKYGRGRVLHVMGHYYQEAGNLAGTVSAQRLALNFVLMRLIAD